MKSVAIWNSESLLGNELKEQLAGRRDLWEDLKLLAPGGDDSARVTDIGGEAAWVLPADTEGATDVDVLLVCPAPDGDSGAKTLPETGPTTTTILVCGERPNPELPQLVVGANTSGLEPGAIVASPPATVVLAAHLAQALQPLGVIDLSLTALLPASGRDQAGVDELLDQARSLLSFQERLPTRVFGRQLAFNLLSEPGLGRELSRSLANVLSETALAVRLQAILAGSFHGLNLAVQARLNDAVQPAKVEAALASSPVFEVSAETFAPSPLDVGGRPVALLGAIEPAGAGPSSGDGMDAVQLHAVADNLALSAANAVGLAEALLMARN